MKIKNSKNNTTLLLSLLPLTLLNLIRIGLKESKEFIHRLNENQFKHL